MSFRAIHLLRAHAFLHGLIDLVQLVEALIDTSAHLLVPTHLLCLRRVLLVGGHKIQTNHTRDKRFIYLFAPLSSL